MSSKETRAFAALPHAEAALLLRRWDDGGKTAGVVVRDLGHYRAPIDRLAHPAPV
jgi:predicted HD phosphohydrolase